MSVRSSRPDIANRDAQAAAACVFKPDHLAGEAALGRNGGNNRPGTHDNACGDCRSDAEPEAASRHHVSHISHPGSVFCATPSRTVAHRRVQQSPSTEGIEAESRDGALQHRDDFTGARQLVEPFDVLEQLVAWAAIQRSAQSIDCQTLGAGALRKSRKPRGRPELTNVIFVKRTPASSSGVLKSAAYVFLRSLPRAFAA
jgi:hypothetical protein